MKELDYELYNNLFVKSEMSAETLYNLISSIRVSRIKLGKDPIESENKKPWTKEEEKLFYQLIIEYGSDLTLIQTFFPERSRKQIKRKHRDMSEIRRKMMQREENRIRREGRKSCFEDEILDQKLIKWISKPNKSGNSSQSETN